MQLGVLEGVLGVLDVCAGESQGLVALAQGGHDLAGLGAAGLDDQGLDGLHHTAPAAVRFAAGPAVQRQAVDPVEREGRLRRSGQDIDQLLGAQPQPRLVPDVLAGR